MKKEEFLPFLENFSELIQARKLHLLEKDGDQYIAEITASEGGIATRVLLKLLSPEERADIRVFEDSVCKMLAIDFDSG